MRRKEKKEREREKSSPNSSGPDVHRILDDHLLDVRNERNRSLSLLVLQSELFEVGDEGGGRRERSNVFERSAVSDELVEFFFGSEVL